jgi:hypothetical protein
MRALSEDALLFVHKQASELPIFNEVALAAVEMQLRRVSRERIRVHQFERRGFAVTTNTRPSYGRKQPKPS